MPGVQVRLSSGKPNGVSASPLEPLVQGRFARIVIAENAMPLLTRKISVAAGCLIFK